MCLRIYLCVIATCVNGSYPKSISRAVQIDFIFMLVKKQQKEEYIITVKLIIILQRE